MALGRTYTVTAGPYTLASTAQTPLLMGATGAAVTADISAIRFSIGCGAGVGFPSPASVQFLLTRPANTPVAGAATTVTPAPHNDTDIAANSTWTTGSFGGGTAWTTPPTAPAVGAAGWLYSQNIPFTAGALLGEWITPSQEWRLSASKFLVVFATCSLAGTATQLQAEVVFTE